MDVLQLARELKAAADLIVTDEAGRSLILVEVRAEVGDELRELAQLREHQQRFDFPFALLANPERILILGSGDLAEPLAELATLKILRAYRSQHADPHLSSKAEILPPLSRWLNASTEEFLTDRHEGHCCFKQAGLADRLVWGHVLTREMLFQKDGAVEPSY